MSLRTPSPPPRRPRRSAALALAVLHAASCASPGTARDPDLLERALEGTPALTPVVTLAAEHRLKIELAEVVPGDPPTLRRWSFDAGPAYWYPASTIKTCAVVAALQDLEQLARETGRPVDRDTPLAFDPQFPGEAREARDASNIERGVLTAGHLARKILLVSDNAAYNRLYDLVGHAGLNERMRALGLDGIRLHHRLSVARTADENRRTPRVELDVPDDGAPLVVPARTSALAVPRNDDLDGTQVGAAHVADGGLVVGPLDFRGKNYARLVDLQDLHVLLLRPDVELARGPLTLSASDRAFVARAMRERPRDGANPVYDPAHYPDDYSKFLLPGVARVVPEERLDVHDKVGRAYGFSATNSYVVDRSTGRAFFLAACLYTNPNGVLNDGVYDYALADAF